MEAEKLVRILERHERLGQGQAGVDVGEHSWAWLLTMPSSALTAGAPCWPASASHPSGWQS